MIDTISEVIIKSLAVIFKLNDKSVNVVEDPNLEFFDNHNNWLQLDEYIFILNQIIHHLIIETRTFLTETTLVELLDNNFNVELPNKFVISVRSKDMPCDVYFTPGVVQSIFYKDLSIITNTSITLAKDINDVHRLYSGPYNQIFLFKNIDEIF